MTYVTNYMRARLKENQLKLVTDGPVVVYRLGRKDTSVYSVYIASFAHRLCLTGDICLGANQHGVVSATGYDIGWFGGQLSEGYLCEKFLRQEWQWEAAVEQIEDLIVHGGEWWEERAKLIRAFIADPGWKYDQPSIEEFYEFMNSIGDDGCELPDSDYPRIEAGWLCAIQQRFRELFQELQAEGEQT